MPLHVYIVLLLFASQAFAVNRPPTITNQAADKNVYFKPGESVMIPCGAEGIPKPTFKWRRNAEDFNPSGHGDRIVQLPNQGSIVFNEPESKDEGIYQCFANNGYGVAVTIRVNFREAKLARFSYERPKQHAEYAGNPLKLPCVPPTSYPPADVFWVVKEPDGRWHAINFDKRISMDLDGSLRFTNIKKTDEQNGKAYSCMAMNYFMRDNSIGPEHTIQVYGTSEQKRPAYILWTSPSDQFFVKGDTMRLKCIFAGNPTPDVYWEKIRGEPMTNTASFKSFGQELQIVNLTEADGGQYQCMGTNTESTTRATMSFDVRIEAAPYWVSKPVNQEKSTNEKAIFECEAAGNPVSVYEWFINGQSTEDKSATAGTRDPRVYKNPRFSVGWKGSKYVLSLSNLTLEDHMNVQCNASNKHGYVFTSVYLNVLEEAPTIITPPPPRVIVAEGQSVLITCTVTGKPDPVITWFRDTNLITGGRFKIMQNGNLVIENVVMADAGDYRCQASNKFAKGITSSSCKMQIRRKTRIEQFPQDLEVIAGNDAKFTCSGSTDFDEAKNMEIYWKKDDKRVSTAEHRMTQNFQDNSLTISGTIVRDSGVYTCVISTGLDEDMAYAFLTVKDRPDPPSSIEVERCREKQADIKWIKGIENNAPVIHFIIQYNTTFNPDQWMSAQTVDYTQNTASIDLLPGAKYTFRVIATNKIGTSSPSYHTTKVCNTNEDVPYNNPRNIQSVGDKKGFLKIQWIPMTENEHNGHNFKYQINVRERGTTSPGDTYNIGHWQNNTLEHPSSLPYQPYIVKIKAQNSKGDSRVDAEEKVLYSFEDIPAAVVTDLSVSNIASSKVTLTWKWEKRWLEEQGQIDAIHGEFRGFKIQYWRASEKVTTFREVEVVYREILPDDLPTGNTQLQATYELVNLSPYSNMQVQVCVMNNYYVGTPSDVATFTTYEGVPGPVPFFEAPIRSSNSFTLVWSRPNEEDRNGIILGYDIAYQVVDKMEIGAMHDRRQQINNEWITTAILSGLLPNRKYRIHIFARTRFGRGEGTFIEVSTTEKSEFGAPNFEIGEIQEHTFNVTWDPGAHYGTHVVHYVEYRLEGGADWQQSTDEVIANYKVITDLERGTYYEVRVVAFDGRYRAYSEIKVVGTVGFAAAKAIAANYGWFIGMLVAGMLFIGLTVFIYCNHRWRKGVREQPRKKKTPRHEDNRYSDDEDSRQDLRGYDDKDHRYDDHYRNEKGGRRGEKDDSYYDDHRDSYHDNRRDSYHDDDRYHDDYDKGRVSYHDDYKRDSRYDRDDYDRPHDYDDRHYDDDHYDDDDRRYDDYDDKNRDRDYDKGYARNGRDRYDDHDDDIEREYDEGDPLNEPGSDQPPPYAEVQKGRRGKRPIRKDRTYDEYGKESQKFDEEGVPLTRPKPAPRGAVSHTEI